MGFDWGPVEGLFDKNPTIPINYQCNLCGMWNGHHAGCPAHPTIQAQKLSNFMDKANKEVKVIDPKTGGEKGSKLQRFSLIPFEFLWQLAEHYGKGAKKYADRNWEKGYAWSLTVDALLRHLGQFLLGEKYDTHNNDCQDDCVEHTGSHHLISAAWHCVALFIFDIRNLGTDDITKKNVINNAVVHDSTITTITVASHPGNTSNTVPVNPSESWSYTNPSEDYPSYHK